MSLKTITIRGAEYPEPSIDRLKRKQAKNLANVMKEVGALEGGIEDVSALDVLWDLVGIVIPTLPEDVLDDLDLGECQEILSDAGLFGEGEVGLGESSASTSS